MPDLDPSELLDLIDTVRLLTGDDETSPMFSELEVRRLLTLTGFNPLRAAAQALDIMATSETLLAKKISSQDLSVDGPAVAAELRRQATELRRQADAEDEAATGYAFEIVEAPYGLPRHPPELTEFGTW